MNIMSPTAHLIQTSKWFNAYFLTIFIYLAKTKIGISVQLKLFQFGNIDFNLHTYQSNIFLYSIEAQKPNETK